VEVLKKDDEYSLKRMYLAENLQIFCKNKHLSKKELAEMARVNAVTVSKVMQGRVSIRSNTVIKIAQAIGIDIKTLLTEDTIKESGADVGGNILKLCAEKNISVWRLSEMSGLRCCSVMKIVSNSVYARRESLNLIAEALGVSVDTILSKDLSV